MKMLQTVIPSYILFGAMLFIAACGADTRQNKDAAQAEHPINQSNSSTMHAHSHEGNIMMQSMSSMMNRMHSMKMSGDPDRDFAEMMIIHHEGAIDMARAELEAGRDSSLRDLASAIVAAQQSEGAKMRSIVSTLPVASSGASVDMASDPLMQSMGGMMRASHSAPMTGDVDKDFVLMMIPHHEGAVEMAKVQLRQGRDADLKRMAQQMVDDQTPEISKMKGWLEAHS